ncbi:2-amino-4-hydroxy-6-hydroxymethyldihydropteridine diphosphokinase [Novosphingobium sp. JCM 18896]|uniref:2-amino-4-hydroxy-6- hydroxymethyldihydropteridine diphosphokinase n=1 Tax=Novosphingobium sp. JCM 18896 TaxID=2989731 RepID=UPI002222CB6F|nr:2-amino-4-hydroxy-6-hydroxymethyldihydropteridine diphosphokinase [Novosphingobium sp. JCM 18896]MCW1429647.1 2-amino-4-hydroxy-6-hydroxymethyldihydropteridine diphosphokinase [Novosphingobium sp. JCM 18896]
MKQRYLIALGSNRRHHRHGDPRGVLRAAFAALDRKGLKLKASSPIMASAPLGPSRRRYANAAALVKTDLAPDALLDRLKTIERRFGRRRGGQAWSTRVLDLDIVLWSGGAWASPGLTVPHVSLRERRFVLAPAVTIAPTWRDPLTGLTLRHLLARLDRRRPR